MSRMEFEPPGDESPDVLSANEPSTRNAGIPSPDKPSLTFWSAFAIVIGLQLGSGIFASPAYVITSTESPTTAICAWLIAGLLAWQGASSLVEFAVTLPHNGGIADYLDFCYGRYWSYLFSFAWIIIGRPCAHATISLILADHVLQAFWPSSTNYHAKVAVAIVALNGTTYLNTKGVSIGARLARVFMVIKIMSAATIVVCGLFFAAPYSSSPPDSKPGGAGRDTSTYTVENKVPLIGQISHLVTAIFAAVFAFGGWENIGFIAGEVDRPSHTLPKTIHTAMPLVLCCFLAINLALYAVLDPHQLETTDAVATVFGQTMFGFAGGVVFAIMVAVSCLGALNSAIFAAARLTREAGARGFLSSWAMMRSLETSILRRPLREEASFTSPSRGPTSISLTQAMWMNAILGTITLLTGTFRHLIVFKGVIEYCFYCITISGIFRLRSRLVATTCQSYKVQTVSPLMFCTVSIFIVVWQACSTPWTVLVFSVMLLIASLAYYMTQTHHAQGYAPVEGR